MNCREHSPERETNASQMNCVHSGVSFWTQSLRGTWKWAFRECEYSHEMNSKEKNAFLMNVNAFTEIWFNKGCLLRIIYDLFMMFGKFGYIMRRRHEGRDRRWGNGCFWAIKLFEKPLRRGRRRSKKIDEAHSVNNLCKLNPAGDYDDQQQEEKESC